jgi:hypothetical protein
MRISGMRPLGPHVGDEATTGTDFDADQQLSPLNGRRGRVRRVYHVALHAHRKSGEDELVVDPALAHY